ncbi:MAG TPA: PilN domain-containing protein [Terriglobales bacterium]|nr:PilN domain-containing protein [Terriglobales bacterium]
MIRINLLGVPRKKAKSRGPVISVGGGVNMTLVGVVILGAVAAGNYYYYNQLNADTQKLQTELTAAKNDNLRLSQIKARYTERQKQFDLYDHRVKVIHQLQESQTGPLDLMATIANTVNNTDAVWLSTMNEDGNNINLSGTALSATAVANLLTNLKKSDYFKTVEIKETHQDEGVKDMQAFQFSIVCEKKQKS